MKLEPSFWASVRVRTWGQAYHQLSLKKKIVQNHFTWQCLPTDTNMQAAVYLTFLFPIFLQGKVTFFYFLLFLVVANSVFLKSYFRIRIFDWKQNWQRTLDYNVKVASAKGSIGPKCRDFYKGLLSRNATKYTKNWLNSYALYDNGKMQILQTLAGDALNSTSATPSYANSYLATANVWFSSFLFI